MLRVRNILFSLKNSRHFVFATCILAACAALFPQPTNAATYSLTAPTSPISAVFDSNEGRFTVTQKADGFVWKNTTTSGGDAIVVNSVSQADATHLSAEITHTSSSAALSLSVKLVPATGELVVTLSGASASIPNGIQYPYAFHPVGHGNNGFAVLPFDSGYVLPESQTSWTTKLSSFSNRRMEWFGGTDRDNEHGWIGILETHADMQLRTFTGTHDGASVIGGVPKWLGSNGNPAHTPNLLSYDRVVRFRFLTTGGYVALAKQFRQWADDQGWVKTLAQKNREDPEHKTDKLIGAPIIYLWGDGRDEALVTELSNAGLRKAVLQISANQIDQNKNFPNTEHPDGQGWMDAVKAKGYMPGFYDIYQAMRVGGSVPAYDGTSYLWPTNQAAAWTRIDSTGAPLVQNQGSATLYDMAMQHQADFAANTRLPAHLSRFGVDAYFFDTTCASSLEEDYDSVNGHFATRGMDLTNRVALLNTAFSNPTKRLITATEQGRSWAVPVLHWAEGKFWLGEPGNLTNTDYGSFNNSSYPSVMVDVVDPTLLTTNKLGPLLSHGWQVPLWDLVFHDCMVNTVHWSAPHNKFLYAWDHADRWALLRGQVPLLDMTRNGAQGTASRVPNTLTDIHGTAWSSRWSTISHRFTQTFNTVCAWAEQVGYLEMTAHRWLTTDRSVQMSEFSDDNGISGSGIVVNFGNYDGAFGVTGTPWSGTQRETSLTVPVADYRTYTWDARPQNFRVEHPNTSQAIVRFSGINGFTYRVEHSQDLVSWADLGTPPKAGAEYELTVVLPTDLPLHFFRVVTSVP